MYECPGCGASLRYDIRTGRLICDFCGYSGDLEDKRRVREARAETITGMDAWTEEENRRDMEYGSEPEETPDADRPRRWEMTRFTCPQCGAEIFGAQNRAVEFCSYCGAQVQLETRLEKEKRPEQIVPFRWDKEECIAKYRQYIRQLPFVPAQLKSEEFQEQFTGIYIPFWSFQIEQKGESSLKGQRVSGNYTEYCSVKANLDTTYDHITFDAASGVDDTMVDELRPFPADDLKPFSPAYLCGFFADTSDVESEVYEERAKKIANTLTLQNLHGQDGLSGMTFPEKDNGNEVLHTEVKGVKRLLMPLWFLTWRTQDRVAYAVVNGVTGKITADVPLDKKKCLAVSLAAAVPLFLIFYFLFPVFLPETQLAAVMLVMGITARIFRRWLKLFGEKETHEWDAGFQSRAQREKKVRSKERKAPVKGTVKLVLIFVGYFFVMLIFDLIVDGAFEAVPLLIGKIVEVVFGTSRYWMSVLGCFFTLLMVLTVRKVIAKTGRKSLWLQGGLAAAGMAVCVAILIWHPVEDFYYYIGMILLLGDILFLLVSLLEYYNQLSTRQLPDFHGRGERA